MDKKLRKPPAFQFYCNDWLSSPTVMLLEPLQELAFFRILLFMWQDDDCGIDPDPEKWGRLTRTDANTCSIVFEQCLNTHPTCSEKLTNLRLYEYALAQTEYHAKKQNAGKKSGEARRRNSKRKTTSENAGETPNSSNRTPVQLCSNTDEQPVRTNANPSSSSSPSSSTSVTKTRECELANSPSANADPSVLTEQDARQVCDAIAETFGIACKLTKARRAKLRTRWRELSFRTDWLAALRTAGEQSFFRGDNDRGWKFSFDFFVKPDSVTNILEGKYDNDKQPTSNAQRRENANAAALSALRFEDDPDVAYAAERVTGDSGDAGAIVLDEESGAVHAPRRGDVGGDSFELPY